MNIGEAAAHSNVPPKTIRYYEEIELVTPERGSNGYRRYSQNDVHRLRFLQRARSLGFSIEECRLLLSLYQDPHRASADVRAMVLDRIARIDGKIADLQALRRTLATLAEKCHGDDRPDCPIIDDLAGR